jgi:hypothetical protein
MVSALQLLPCRRSSLDWCLWPFLSPLYTIFLSSSPLKPCGYCTCLIMMQNVRPQPTSTPLHDTFFSVTFEWDVPSLLQVVVAGVGSTTTNIKMNTKWLCNTSRSHPTSAWQVLVPFLLQAAVAGDGSTSSNIKMNTKWNGYRLKLTLNQLTFESFDSFLRWMTSISNRLKDSRLFWKYSSAILSKFQTHNQSIFISWCPHSWALLLLETSFLCQ